MMKQIAWALNKGIKADYKQYWDVELGVTYVPWDKVKPEELESFCEGGILDSDTLNPGKETFPFFFLNHLFSFKANSVYLLHCGFLEFVFSSTQCYSSTQMSPASVQWKKMQTCMK